MPEFTPLVPSHKVVPASPNEFSFCSLVMPMGRKRQVKRRIVKRKVAGRRSNAQQVLAAGVGKAVTKAFGNTGFSVRGWDAFHPSHLPLPRPVAPYTVVRTTVLVKNANLVNIFGTSQFDLSNAGATTAASKWTPVIGFSSVNPGNPISGAGNAQIYKTPDPGFLGGNVTCVPSAMSVQCMNPEALQTASGIIAGAVSNTQLNFRDTVTTWQSFADNFVSFQRPRLMAASKLALRGVQGDSYPMNMNKVSEFAGLAPNYLNDQIITWNDNSGLNMTGWAPIVFINQSGKDLNYLVTVEWRVRFDMFNPAVSSHTSHGHTSDATWESMIQRHVSLGHGMMDIAERVANFGAAAYGMYRGAAAAAGPALAGARNLPLIMA